MSLREYFLADRTASSLGVFGTVAGTLASRRGGPTTADGTTVPAPGVSANLSGTADCYGQITNVAGFQAGVRFGDFYCFKSFVPSAGGSTKAVIQAIHNYNQWNELVSVSIDKNGLLTTAYYQGGGATQSYQLALNTWYWIAIEYLRPGGTGNYQAQVKIKPAGGALTILGPVGPFNPIFDITNLHVGMSSGNYNPCLRVGGLVAEAIASLDGSGVPADLVEPTDTALDWYLDPVNGNDAHDGATLATAWQSAAKVTSETASGGILSRASYAGGDTLYIANADGPLGTFARQIAGPLTLSADGLNVVPASGFTKYIARAVKALANANFAPVAGHPNVYQIADAGVAGAWVGEMSGNDPVWYDVPTGATFAAVSATLDAAPGSGFNDGTYTYVHAIGSSDPRSDGKVYFSQISAAGHLIGLGAKHLHLSNVEAWGQINVGTAGYSVQYCIGDAGSGGFGGTVLLENINIHHWNNHGLGLTNSTVNADVTIRNLTVSQGSPYGMAGNHTPAVSYQDGTNGESGNVHLWQGCDFRPYRGVVGTTGQALDLGMWAWITHNAGNANKPYASLTLKNCQLGGGTVGRNTVNTDVFTLDNCGSFVFSASDLVPITVIDRNRPGGMPGIGLGM